MQAFDKDGDALDAVTLAHWKANETGKPYCIVSSPSGALRTVPLDHCRIAVIETIWPDDDYPYESR